MTKKIIKVRIHAQTIEIDAEAWMVNFGVSAECVKQDVIAYMRDRLQEQAEYIGCGKA